MGRRWLIGAVLAALALGAGAAEKIWQVQDFVVTVGTVDGAPLRVPRDSSRKANCYFWKSSLSCVKE